MKNRLLNDNKLFSIHTLLLVAVGILVNYIGVVIAHYFDLPIFLDSIGTVLAAALGGYLPGIIVGFFSNVINAGSDPITLYYGLISIMIAFSAAYLANKGAFKKVGVTIISIFVFAFIGGVLGSVLTWMLYGLNIGEGISASFSNMLYNSVGLPKFFAQLTADFVIDIVDKAISVIFVVAFVRIVPHKMLEKLPYGYRYDKSLSSDEYLKAQNESGDITNADTAHYRHISLRHKIEMLIMLTAVILIALSVTISFIIYKNTMDDRYANVCGGVTELMSKCINTDKINDYLSSGVTDEEYDKTEQDLIKIKEGFPDITYMYVYQIREDGCHVVFDLDTQEVQGGDLGEVVEFDEAFVGYKQDLLEGKQIDYVIANGSYGWLLTSYRPLKDSSGKTVAYAAADISMVNVIADRYVFIIRIMSLMIGVSILIIAFSMWFAQKKIVEPINALATESSKFAFESESSRKANAQSLKKLDIRTGDEIENLYGAMIKTVNDMNRYTRLISEKTADIKKQADTITKMQDNIIVSFAGMVESRDENTGDHIKRTSAFVDVIARELKKEGKFKDILTEEYMQDLIKSAPLHDIGKIKVPDAILNKPGKLTEEEFDEIKKHTIVGRDILENAFIGIQGKTILWKLWIWLCITMNAGMEPAIPKGLREKISPCVHG